MFLDAIHSQLSTTPRNTGSNTRLARALRERLFPRSTERGPIEARWTTRYGTSSGLVSTLYRAWPH